jgi:hypothetical protein
MEEIMKPHRTPLLLASGVLQQAPLQTLCNVNYRYALHSSFTGFLSNPAYAGVVFAPDLKPTSS